MGAQPPLANPGPGSGGGGGGRGESSAGGGGGNASVGGGDGGGADGSRGGGDEGNDFEFPVSSVVQPPALKDGAAGDWRGGGGEGGVGRGSEGGRLYEVVAGSTADRPVRVKSASLGASLMLMVVQPAFLNPLDFVSLTFAVSKLVAGASTGTGDAAGGGLVILIPAAFASFLSSFSSRLRSFSFRFSTSS